MAEVIALGASIIAVIQIADRIIGLTKYYIEGVQDAPRDLHIIRIETSTLKAVFESLKFVQDSGNAASENFQNLARQDGVITGCRRVVSDLEKLIGPEVDTTVRRKRRKIQATLSDLAWPLKESKAKKLLDEMARYKTTITLALSNESVQASLATKAGMDRLHERQDNRECRDEQQAILDWLTPIDYASQQNDFISRRQPGTGQWLLDSAEFQEWLKMEKKTLFCLGIPGAGKTIITCIVIENLYRRFQNDTSIGIAYIYCNFRRQYEQNPEDLLASLLKQFVQQQNSIPNSVKVLYNHHRDKRTCPTLEEISKVLHLVVTNYSRAFIIIDALDECQISNGSRSRFLSEIFNIQAKTGASFLATSRFIPEIMKEFERRILIEIRASRDDVRRYLNGKISKLRPFVSRNLTLQEEIKTEIIEAVDGMFLLAQLYLDFLIDKTTPKAIRFALNNFRKESKASNSDRKVKALHHAYAQAMERINGYETGLAKQVLSWITCVKRPLTTVELQHALAVEVGEEELDEENLPEIEDMVSVCAGLVTVDEESDIIRLVHYTTQEYFERAQKDWFPDAETDIAKTCITYLSFNTFESGFCRTKKEFEARLRLNPLYDYAARNWGHHARAALTEMAILAFLESEAKVSSSSQALIASGSRYGYSQKVPKQMTGIHIAAYFGLGEAVVALLKNGHDPNSKDGGGRTPLSWAAANGYEAVVKLLLARDGVDPDSRDLKYGRTPLSRAAENGHEAVVKLLLAEKEVDLDSIYGRTPLSWAAANGHEAVVKLLLAKDGVDPDSKDGYGRTPLSWAEENQHEAIMRLLQEAKGRSEKTALHQAARSGDGVVVQRLLGDGANVNVKGGSGETALHLAAGSGHEAVTQLLLQNRVDVDAKDSNGETALHHAAENGYKAVAKLLLENGADIAVKNKRGRTPLHWAARSGRKEVAKLLLEKGADVNAKGDLGGLALHWAAENGHEAVVELLLRCGADVAAKNKYGKTALHWAAGSGHEAVVQLLLKNWSDVNSNGNSGTALYQAAKSGHMDVMRLLLEKGADISAEDESGLTALDQAIKNGHKAAAQLLLRWMDSLPLESTPSLLPPIL